MDATTAPSDPRVARILTALTEVIDPEVGIDIVNLGLVYDVRASDESASVRMTMTTPACPLGPYLSEQVEAAIRGELGEGAAVDVEVVWDPPWSPERMSREARRTLGWPDEEAPRD